MARICLFIVVCLALLAVARSVTSIGTRIHGDKLLMSKNVQRNLSGRNRVKHHFRGRIITRIEISVPRRLESFYDLDIVEGGVNANFVEFGVNFLNLINAKRKVRIYGMKVKPGVGRHASKHKYDSNFVEDAYP